MDDGLKDLLEKAAQLDAEQRAELVERLIDVDVPAQTEWEAAWGAEAQRRLAEHRQGTEPSIAAEDVLAEGRRRAAARQQS